MLTSSGMTSNLQILLIYKPLHVPQVWGLLVQQCVCWFHCALELRKQIFFLRWAVEEISQVHHGKWSSFCYWLHVRGKTSLGYCLAASRGFCPLLLRQTPFGSHNKGLLFFTTRGMDLS